ncbi:MAG: C4-dicarboxylate transporter substrate-binding protein [Rickettsiaceae bacterium]|jgi:TRAP transporter TAXI family solute receptor|nr:C4-dicarboxylate transporter substrate-binding protein [Rickettsiaceae bacterium]
MKKFSAAKLLSLFVGGFVLALVFVPKPSAAADKFVTIGTGGVTGVYYPTGGAICRLVNRGRKEHGIRCSVESTGGSVYNINALRDGGLDLAVAQSDWQYHSYNGTGIFADQGAFKGLRSVFSLHTEAFTVVVRADSGINTFDDIVGKRVNVGNPGSGNRATMEVIMAAKGWTKENFKVASELKGSEQPQALCDNKIDVMIYNAGHPNGAVQEVATSCDVKIISVSGSSIDSLVKDSPYYAYTIIPGGMYAGNPDDIKTFGVKATFVTSEKVDEEIIYQVVKAVFDNFDNFKTLHPVFANLDPKKMIREGNAAPLHKGAERYFKEKGLM